MLPVYSASEIKRWDGFTIDHLPISSVDLMEKAAEACFLWIRKNLPNQNRFVVFCGNGNNGGDGLAVARKLYESGQQVFVVEVPITNNPSKDYIQNLNRLIQLGFKGFIDINGEGLKHSYISTDTWIVDALVGYGLNRIPDQELSLAIRIINSSECPTLSIDIPSGMYTDQPTPHEFVHSEVTLTFQAPKLAQLLAGTGQYCGKLVILDIGLLPDYMSLVPPAFRYLESKDISPYYKMRNLFSFKNQFGHVVIVGGQLGMAGACSLAGLAAIRSGAGLTSICSYAENRIILQSIVPEAMFCGLSELNFEKYQVVALGPGMGQSAEMMELVSKALHEVQGGLVLDADALNIIGVKQWEHKIPKASILTPHPREFDRMFGPSMDDFDRIKRAISFAKELEVVIILKGRYTLIACPDGNAFFNSTGNPGMSKGGSGDVLCGMVAAFLAQKYDPVAASLISVFLHGLSADLCAEKMALESIRPIDLIDHISNGFLQTFYK